MQSFILFLLCHALAFCKQIPQLKTIHPHVYSHPSFSPRTLFPNQPSQHNNFHPLHQYIHPSTSPFHASPSLILHLFFPNPAALNNPNIHTYTSSPDPYIPLPEPTQSSNPLLSHRILYPSIFPIRNPRLCQVHDIYAVFTFRCVLFREGTLARLRVCGNEWGGFGGSCA